MGETKSLPNIIFKVVNSRIHKIYITVEYSLYQHTKTFISQADAYVYKISIYVYFS